MQWKVADVNNAIKDALRKDISRIRVKNTNHLPFEAPEKVYEELRKYDVDRIASGDLPKNVPEDAYDYL